MLQLKLADIDNIRITKDNGWAVHFSIRNTHYLVKQYDDAGDYWYCLYLKGKKAEQIASKYGDIPHLRYRFNSKVYSQALIRPWILELASEGLIEIVKEDGKSADIAYLAEHLTVSEMKTLMGIWTNTDNPCSKNCQDKRDCPFAADTIRTCHWYHRRTQNA